MITLFPIGYVHNKCMESMLPELIKQEISEIEVFPEYAEGLEEVEACRYLDLVFYLHQNECVELNTRIRTGEQRGIFATRSPNRPNHLGITTVKLQKRVGNKLYVEGADALNGSPVLDLKCCDTSVYEQENIHNAIRVDSPRIDIVRNILSNDTEELLLKSAQLHGHICPGLALGVLGAVTVMQKLYEQGADPGDYTLTVEMQNCAVDALLFVTGCTPGTHRFQLGDPARMSFSVKNQKGQGWKVHLKDSNREWIAEHVPDSFSAAERGFAVLKLDFDDLFEMTELPEK
ncbi:tRNA (N6-threonylcarbamoyladenosine(37)-N6)-methyltransferase TrmO [uncultured Odoribacter sp.]|uniref:tRNA (N6-threonylcarbamoyladenosine(37)-N6)-methyltransferase TrmO n=1 Tax=uncultured Odoribacter sp. TaxID=876416 RepID=UPI002603E31C|nr:tRNA (N6-threonylcarbamoyladenosine(37)-N6)-methyltransferase TrmO [uncultured Odoribacter sp.]